MHSHGHIHHMYFMPAFVFVILFIFGLIIGSFLNVATMRYDPDRGFSNLSRLGGRSMCPHCHTTLAWYELVPLFSFFALRGRCRHCRGRISWQYPLVELLTALLFVAVPMRIAMVSWFLFPRVIVPFSPMYIAISSLWVVAFVVLLTLSIIDFRLMIIPDMLTLSIAGVGLLFTGLLYRLGGFGLLYGSFVGHYAALFGLRYTPFFNHVIAALIGILFFGLIIGVSRGRAMGWGDLKLAGALGLLFGWPDIGLILAVAFIVGAIISIGLMAWGRKTMRDAVPFGPFLVIAATIIFFFGTTLLSRYFALFAAW